MRFRLICIFLMVLNGTGIVNALEQAGAEATLKTVTLDIQKMNCPMCKITIGRALKKVDGVTAAKVDYDTKTAVVTFDPKKANIDSLTEATTNVGYPSALKME